MILPKHLVVTRASMGPRLKDVEDAWLSSMCCAIRRLQWGHVSRTWKTCGRYANALIINRLQWGHVSRTWKTSGAASGRCDGWRFNGATSQGRGRLCQAGCLGLAGPGFNGATSQGRGRLARFALAGIQVFGFNGATSQGRGRPDATDNQTTNGETLQWGHVSRTWKTHRSGYTRTGESVVLQWGHVSRTWKTGEIVTAKELKDWASMGPRLKDVEDAQAASPASRRTLLQWGHVSRTWKTSAKAMLTPPAATLQWGHVSRTWKSRWACRSFGRNWHASMGPRLKDVEDAHANRSRYPSYIASMGPRLKDVEDARNPSHESADGCECVCERS